MSHIKLSKYCDIDARLVNNWNSLPDHIVNAGSLNVFKNSLDRLWATQDILYNYRGVREKKLYVLECKLYVLEWQPEHKFKQIYDQPIEDYEPAGCNIIKYH